MADFDFVETDSAKIYTAIIGKLMEYCNEPLYPGDERRIFGEGLVMVLTALYNEFNDAMKQRTLRYARGAVLDALGERYGVDRLAPASASATFRFAVSAAQATNIVIPAGTRITSDGSVYFATQGTVILPAGGTEIDVLGVCTSGGSEYNGYVAGSINTLVDLIPYIGSVANITDTAGGDDGEPYTEEGDDKYRQRIRLAPASLSTAGPESAYRYFALSADPNIVDVHIDTQDRFPGEVNITLLMAGGEKPSLDVINKVVRALSNDVRPMTDYVHVVTPSFVEYSIEVKYYCTAENEAATILAIEGEGGAIDQYIEWQSAKLGRDINPDQLRRFMLAPANGVGAIRVDVVSPTFQGSIGNAAKFSGSLVVSHEVVTE